MSIMKLVFSLGILYLIYGSSSLDREFKGTLQNNIDTKLDVSVGFIQSFFSPSVSYCGALCASAFSCISAEFDSISKKCYLFQTRKSECRSTEKKMYTLKKECSSPSVPIAGLCVKIVTTPKKSHVDAESYCQGQGGHLLSIFDDFTRNEMLASLSSHPLPPHYWVSGRRVTGTDTFLDWRGMEIPLVDNDFTVITEDCALISKRDLYTQDWICEYNEMFICQY